MGGSSSAGVTEMATDTDIHVAGEAAVHAYPLGDMAMGSLLPRLPLREMRLADGERKSVDMDPLVG